MLTEPLTPRLRVSAFGIRGSWRWGRSGREGQLSVGAGALVEASPTGYHRPPQEALTCVGGRDCTHSSAGLESVLRGRGNRI